MPEHLISPADAENDILACSAYIAESIRSNDGLAEAMSAIVPLYLAKSDVDLAAALSDTVQDSFSRDKLLLLVAEKCSEIDDIDYAQQLAEAMDDHGIQAQAFEKIGVQQAVKSNFEQAEYFANLMADPDYVYAAIAAQQAADGDGEAAAQTLESIVYPGAKLSSLLAIAALKIKEGNHGEAAELIQQAEATADEIEHDEEALRTRGEIGEYYLAAGMKDRSIAAFEKVRAQAATLDNIHREYFLGNASLGFLHAGSLELADRALDEIRDKSQIASCLLGFSRQFWTNGEKDEAVESLEEAFAVLKSQRETETRDRKSAIQLMLAIAVQFAIYGNFQRAMDIAQEIADPDQEISAFHQIAQMFALTGDEEHARQALAAIREDASRVNTLIVMSDAKAKLENPEGAVSLLDEAFTMAQSIPLLVSRTQVLNTITERFAVRGQQEKSHAALIQNLLAISHIKDASVRAVSLAKAAEGVMEIGLELTDEERSLLQKLAHQL